MNIAIRPSVRNTPSSALKMRRIGIVVFGGLVFLSIYRTVLVGVSGLALNLIVAMVAIFLLLLIVFVPIVNRMAAKNASVFVTDESIGMTDFMGRRRVFPRSELSHVLLHSVASGSIPTAYTFFVSQDGCCLFKVASHQWALDDIRRLCQACSVPLEGSWDNISDLAHIKKELPNSFS